MRTVSVDELSEILEKHKRWLLDEKDGEQATLRYANLSGANLSGADLRRADLSGANLSGADLRRADLSDATLSDATLYGADLSDATLRYANLRYANLSGADLSGADLSDATLYCANLSGANLRHANLRSADLRRADLRGADLRRADLRGAVFANNEVMSAFGYLSVCPEKGAFIGFKKAGGLIVELLIPEDAQRSSATTRKCRCSKAKVLSITNADGSDSSLNEVRSDHDRTFIYRIGETAEVPDFDGDRWKECAPGIHFFITRQEAVEYCG